jgi:hypothetical protein
LTARAGGFDIERDVRTHHGPLGALYPTNTGLPQKEGDTMAFLYLVPTGMNDPNEPTWGSWAGRYGLHAEYPGKPYYWANQTDAWQGTTNRDNTLARWAVALQNDFRARMDWCATGDFHKANHAPVAILNGDPTKNLLHVQSNPGEIVRLSAQGSQDPDGNSLQITWFVYPEAGTFTGQVDLTDATGATTGFTAPAVEKSSTIHVVLQLEDSGAPSLCAFRRAVVTVQP